MAYQEQQARAPPRGVGSGSLQPRIFYLTAYNILFAALWVSVGVTAIKNISEGKSVLFEAVEPLARWVQTFTLIEVIHAAVGKFKLAAHL
jgi:very-long-chain (3R)-3-hydroxyacyl-CoA dehydratase